MRGPALRSPPIVRFAPARASRRSASALGLSRHLVPHQSGACVLYGIAVVSVRADRRRNRRLRSICRGVVERRLARGISWIAANPNAGDVIPGSGGCRKVRWTRQGQGKRGGARVIYFVASGQTIWLLIVYAKAKFDNLPAEFLAELKREVEDE